MKNMLYIKTWSDEIGDIVHVFEIVLAILRLEEMEFYKLF